MPMLTPQAYCYLRHPILSSGETMLQYTIQHLCITGGIRMERRRVQAHPRDPRMVSRILLSRVNRHPVTTRTEAYVQELFPRGKEVSIGQLRGTIKKELPDLEAFKYEQVLPDLIDAGMLRSRFVRTDEGVEAMQGVRRVRKFIERSIDDLLKNDRDTLITNLNTLGSNVVLLDMDTRDKLRGMLKEFPDLTLTMNIGSTLENTVTFDAFTAFDTLSFGDSFDAGSADFGGFGDGDFGGGGGGGDW
ncbi:MAG: hypothetical protein JNL43_07655 [Flavobacteriales bacterium]|nr:hypothetical protein [Flavobacteriales bacterium]